MNIRLKNFIPMLVTMMLTVASGGVAKGQIMNPGKYKLDTIQCPIIGFSVSPVIPSARFSHAKLPDGSSTQSVTMAELYKAPYLDFGLHALFKTQSNWVFGIDGNIWFGNDNLNNRIERMGSVFSRDSLVISTMGMDANVTCYNRYISVQGSAAKIIPLSPDKNPNSGLLLKLAGGYLRGQTIFMINNENAPQIDGDYALLYDHQRHGVLLSEGFGYWFMSNYANLVNFSITLEVSQSWTTSTRDYMIDDYAGLHGKDGSKYFDLIYSLKLCWMFPLRGKTPREYYYY